MAGQTDQPEENYYRSSDQAWQMLAYLSPYLFWATVCAICGGVWILQ